MNTSSIVSVKPKELSYLIFTHEGTNAESLTKIVSSCGYNSIDNPFANQYIPKSSFKNFTVAYEEVCEQYDCVAHTNFALDEGFNHILPMVANKVLILHRRDLIDSLVYSDLSKLTVVGDNGEPKIEPYEINIPWIEQRAEKIIESFRTMKHILNSSGRSKVISRSLTSEKSEIDQYMKLREAIDFFGVSVDWEEENVSRAFQDWTISNELPYSYILNRLDLVQFKEQRPDLNNFEL